MFHPGLNPDSGSMTTSDNQHLAFESAVKTITGPGKARIAAALRDLFTAVLGYKKTDILLASDAAPGRPDITISAPGSAAGRSVPWIIGVCRDKPGVLRDADARHGFYAASAAFLSADTAFFLMADPEMLVIRRIGSTSEDPIAWRRLDLEAFSNRLAMLRADIAGIPQLMSAFRDGDESLIAHDRLWLPPDADAETRLAARICRNIFFDALTEATGLLQQATLNALLATRDARHEISARVTSLGKKHPGYIFRAGKIMIERAKRQGHGKERTPRKDAALARRLISRKPELARLTLEALPAFAGHSGLDPVSDADRLERLFANQTARLLLARVLTLRFLEDHGFFDEVEPQGSRRHYLCNRGVLREPGGRGLSGYDRVVANFTSGTEQFGDQRGISQHGPGIVQPI